jgi:acyl-CoA reductase-like NAD-dependent aldehyde dehydrogenase
VPTDKATTMGPLISAAQRDKVLGFIGSAIDEGARLISGGGPPKGNPALEGGFFIEPTVFVDVQPWMRIAREEIFGPVASVLKWRDEDEVFRIANDTEYGLTASIWTHDIARAQNAVRKIEAGYVWVNQVRDYIVILLHSTERKWHKGWQALPGRAFWWSKAERSGKGGERGGAAGKSLHCDPVCLTCC